MKTTKTNVRLSRDGKYLIVNINGEVGIFNANFIRYHLGVPYTRKNGMQVSERDIAEIKQKSQAAYVQRIQLNLPESA